MRRILYIVLLMGLTSWGVTAQVKMSDGFLRTSKGWEFELKAGVNFVGGTAPMGLPVEIRKINGYKPRFGASFEGVAMKWFGPHFGKPEWGLSAGLRVENRGMTTMARVKNFHTIVPMDNQELAGYWTGNVEMNYSSTLLSVPLLLHYRFNKDWKVRSGLYAGYQIEGKFGGAVYDGYLREGTPVGQKLVIDNVKALYDFTKEMQRWQWGMQLGFSWRAYRHFHINTDFNWGFSNIFKSHFKAIGFKMYPIYMQAGFGYQF